MLDDRAPDEVIGYDDRWLPVSSSATRRQSWPQRLAPRRADTAAQSLTAGVSRSPMTAATANAAMTALPKNAGV